MAPVKRNLFPDLLPHTSSLPSCTPAFPQAPSSSACHSPDPGPGLEIAPPSLGTWASPGLQ